MKPRVLLIDDDSIMLLEKYLHAMSSITLVAPVDYKEAIMMAKHEQFDAILMDGSFGDYTMDNGPGVVRSLRTLKISTRIVMFSSSFFSNMAGINNGANDVWNKDRLGSPGWEKSLLEVLFLKK
ncbi:MAG: response regulator [Candidatus Kaiserbacteria bacterium]|nr:response regulator [Candidatus Kaiserbacteria bacterium]